MSIAAPTESMRRLRVPGYFILVLALTLPLVDTVMSVLPIKLDAFAWRFGAMGLFASAVGAPLLVLFLIYALAFAMGDRKVIAACGVMAAVLALIMLVGVVSFSLDALQMKSRIQAAGQLRFYTASVQATLKLVLQGIASLVFAVSAFRALGDRKLAAPKIDRRPSASLVVGRSISNRAVERAEPGSLQLPVSESKEVTPSSGE